MAGINASDIPIHCIAILDIKETEAKCLSLRRNWHRLALHG